MSTYPRLISFREISVIRLWADIGPCATAVIMLSGTADMLTSLRCDPDDIKYKLSRRNQEL